MSPLRELRLFLARIKVSVEILKKLEREDQIASFLAKEIKKHEKQLVECLRI